jgi:surface polysaccharide O-acyltransferase-like enzyme
MYLSACLSPLFADKLPFDARVNYIALIPVFFVFCAIADFILCKLASLTDCETWMVIYERSLNEEKRIYGLDVVRFFAVISVPAIHFLGLTGYYNTPLVGGKMFLVTCMRWLFICCVPLFLTLTGCLKHNNGINFKHYKSIFVMLATHIFITCIRLYVDKHFLGTVLTPRYIFEKLVYFEYGWYVKLYICIMLLAPFANMLWHSLTEKVHKELLILTLIFLCSMGPLTFDIVPKSWVIIYVFIYYFMGAYLSEYEVYINKWLNLLLIAAMLVVISLGCFLHPTAGGVFNWDFGAYSANSGYSSLPAVILTFLIVTLLIDADTHFKPIQAFFYSFSVVSLEMYMFSQMFDGLIYPKLGSHTFIELLPKMPIVLGCIILLSYVASHIKRLIFLIASLPLRLFNKQ